ncbi:uncharacterized protein PAC_08206 [Phialocephala subalpina]|uniref:CCHC-type domain-containing protein n=1 Tax=Phialocephala subalpina TaxID=576137 RepID=A0A1L7WZW9_9HELO|nr:uncharacterized protein PAC_08206 [Phialocephala subalpina]
MALNNVRKLSAFGNSRVQIGNNNLTVHVHVPDNFIDLTTEHHHSRPSSQGVIGLTIDLPSVFSTPQVSQHRRGSDRASPLTNIHRTAPSRGRLAICNSKEEIRCLRCDLGGHTYGECYANSKTVDRGRQARLQSGRCLFCGEEGHWQDDCLRKA